MDGVAYITATRFAKKKMITVSSDKIQFLLPIKSGAIAEIIDNVSKVKNVTIEIHVEIYLGSVALLHREFRKLFSEMFRFISMVASKIF